MMDLIHSHNYIELYEAQKRKEWNQKKGMQVRDAVGRRVGVLGYGSIGRQGELKFRSSFLSHYAVSITMTREMFSRRLSAIYLSFSLHFPLIAKIRGRFKEH
jgi:phosphoglycerate dehydrogenase-like enzyme